MNTNQKRIILIGFQGHGKTALYNKITGIQRKTKYGGEADTKNIYMKPSSFGLGFQVMDTPGFGSEKQRLQHTASIIAALTEGPLNRICLVIRNDRIATMERDLKSILPCCSSYMDLVTVVVTHMDLSEDKISQQNTITKFLNEKTINSMIFVAITNNGSSVCKMIDEVLRFSDSRQIILTDNQICRQFEFIEIATRFQDKLAKQRDQCRNDFYKIGSAFLKFINNYREFEDKDWAIDVLHSVCLEIKDRAKTFISQFQEQHAHELNELFDVNGNNIMYLHDIILKKEIFHILQEVIEKALQRMSEIDGYIFSSLRYCPHCKLIWLKVNRCGKVTCGEVPQERDTLLDMGSTPIRIKFDLSEETVRVLSKKQDVIKSYDANKSYLENIMIQQNQDATNRVNIQKRQLSEINQLITKLEEEFKNLLQTQKTLEEKNKSWFSGLFTSDTSKLVQQINKQKIEINQIYQRELKNKKEIISKKFFGCGEDFDWDEAEKVPANSLRQLTSPDLVNFFQQTSLEDEEKQALQINLIYEKLIKDQVKLQKEGIIKQ